MQSKNKDWFFYDGHSWSRVILRGGGDYRFQIAIKLTDTELTNVELRDVLISKTHYTNLPSSGRCIYTHVLPEYVQVHLEESYSKDRINTLLHADLYPLIDWDRFRKAEKNYVPLAECIKECGSPYHDLEVKFEGSNEVFMSMTQFYEKFQIAEREGYIGIGGYHEANGMDDLLAYLTYETMTGKVVMDVRSSTQNFDTITRFQCHRTKDWQEEFNSGIHKLRAGDQIAESCVYDLKTLVQRAAVYISSFN